MRDMNEKQDFTDIGDKIRTAVQDAVATGDFSRLNNVVNDTVGGAMDEVRRQVNQVHDRLNRPGSYSSGRTATERGSRTTTAAGSRTTTAADGRTTTETGSQTATQGSRTTGFRHYRYPRQNRQTESFQTTEGYQRADGTMVYRSSDDSVLRRIFNKSSKVTGILYTVFGAIGLGIFGITSFAVLLAALLGGFTKMIAPLLLFLVLAGGFSCMLSKGCSIQSRLKEAERYLKFAREDMYIRLEDLSAQTGQSVRRLRKNLRRMLQAGIFPEGHLDSKETIFVLNDETWQQYLIEEKEYKEKQQKSEKPREEAAARQDLTAEQQIEKEGQAYMERLRELNVAIPGEVISNRLYQLDYLLQRIFLVLKEHPEKCPQMRKFMDYYLPTTVKLVESYADFDRAGVQGENIKAAKAEIEKTMDTINQAFEQLLDDMYQDAAFEAAADAKVLKTMLAQDGFARSAFSQDKEKEGENNDAEY